MIGFGTIINSIRIVAGRVIGTFTGKLFRPEQQDALTKVCGISVLFIAIAGAMQGMLNIEDGSLTSGKSMLVVLSLAVGTVIGELIGIENGFERFGEWLKRKAGNSGDPDFLMASIRAGELYIGTENETIISSMVLNHESNEGYQEFNWPTKAEACEVTVIHALGVHPSCNGKGYARQLVQFAVETARNDQQKVIRLDVLKGNLPAENLYSSMGFQLLHTLPMYYEDTGWTEYELYEYVL